LFLSEVSVFNRFRVEFRFTEEIELLSL